MTTRKEFVLGVPLAAATLPTIAATTTQPIVASGTAAFGSYRFDDGRFAEISSRAASHRNMFAAKRAGGGDVLFAIRNTIVGWRAIGVGVHEINAVAVLYAGDAVMLGLNDAVWNELLWPSGIASNQQPAFESALPPGPGHGNPFYRTTASTGDFSVEGLSAAGVSFLLCDAHLREIASRVAPRIKRDEGEIYARLLNGAIPSGLVVPSGVWAIATLQEAHFSYLQVNE